MSALLPTWAALSIDDTDGCVLGYLRRLPEAGAKFDQMADEEQRLLERAQSAMRDLRIHRAHAHRMALSNWSETEIKAATKGDA